MKTRLRNLLILLTMLLSIICFGFFSSAESSDEGGECQHSFSLKKSDRDIHWNECEKCSEKSHIELHTFEDGVCTICGEEEVLYGDANGDGKIDSKDVILLKKYIANLDNGKSSVTLGPTAVTNEKGVTDKRIPVELYALNDSNSTVGEKDATFYGDANGDGAISSKDIILLKKYIANLNDGKSSVILGHNAVVEPGHPATCTQDGMTVGIKCTACEKVLASKEVIPASGHVEGEIIVDVEPTESEKGSGHTECKKCGKTVRENIQIGAASCDHVFGEWTVTKAATCTEDGKRERACANCGEKEIEIIKSAGGHNFGSWTVTKAATCTEDGKRERACANCGEKENETIKSAGGHNFGSWTVTKAATCTEDGKRERACANCGEKEIETIKANGHVEGDIIVDIEPTETAKGSGHTECVNCGKKIQENIPIDPVRDYTYTVNDDGTTCTVIGYKGTKKSITIPESIDGYTVTAIGNKAFADCTQLTEINIPSTVKTIGTRAFYGCTGITEITIPESVTSIGTQIFYKATNLTTVCYYSSYYSYYSSDNPVLLTASISKVVFKNISAASFL